jgi:hypothetical protein
MSAGHHCHAAKPIPSFSCLLLGRLVFQVLPIILSSSLSSSAGDEVAGSSLHRPPRTLLHLTARDCSPLCHAGVSASPSVAPRGLPPHSIEPRTLTSSPGLEAALKLRLLCVVAEGMVRPAPSRDLHKRFTRHPRVLHPSSITSGGATTI